MTTALEGGEGLASRPGHSLPPWKIRYPLYRRLGGPQGRSGLVRKISPPREFDPRTVQPVASRYTDWATRPFLYLYFNKKFSLMYMRTRSELNHIHVLAKLNPCCPVTFSHFFFPPEIIYFIENFPDTAIFSWIQAQRANVVNNIKIRSNAYLFLSPVAISHLPTWHIFLLLSKKGKMAFVSTFLYINGLTIWSPAVPYTHKLLKL
jgi:hypothetical protein